MADGQNDLPFDAAKLAATSRYSIFNERYNAPSRRTELLLSHTPRHALLFDIQFTPRFVEKAFQQWYTARTIIVHLQVSLPADVAIWGVCCLVSRPFSVMQLYTVLCMMIAATLCHYQRTNSRWHEWHIKHLRAVTTFRRLLTIPSILLLNGSKNLQTSSAWQMILWHLVLRPGTIHNVVLSFFYLDYWAQATALSLLGALVLGGTSATPACQDLLSAQQPAVVAVVSKIATFLDKASAGIFSVGMMQQDMAIATCAATSQTIQLVMSCASICGLYAFEQTRRLRYKQTLPPSIAAMQRRICMSSWPLYIGQVLLLILYPVLVVAWVSTGLYHGLRPHWRLAAAGTAANIEL